MTGPEHFRRAEELAGEARKLLGQATAGVGQPSRRRPESECLGKLPWLVKAAARTCADDHGGTRSVPLRMRVLS
jgi:hypothetical protein